MTTGEGDNPRDRQESSRPGERIGVGGGDDSVSRIQLAARWAEAYGKERDSLSGVLKRFRVAYEYLDAVIHGVEPPDLELEPEATAARPTAGGVPGYAPPSTQAEPSNPSPQWATPSSPEPAAPPTERERPWP